MLRDRADPNAFGTCVITVAWNYSRATDPVMVGAGCSEIAPLHLGLTVVGGELFGGSKNVIVKIQIS